MVELLQSLIDNLARGIGQVPPAIMAMILLGGPTLAWIIWRIILGPRFRVKKEPGTDTSWVCAECSSINPPRQRRCYRCRAENPAEVVEVDAAGRPTLVGYPVRRSGAASADYDDEDDEDDEYDDEDDEDDDEDDEYEGEYDDEDDEDDEYEDDEDDEYDDEEEEEVGVAVGPARREGRSAVGIPIQRDEPAVVSSDSARRPRSGR